jgi:hypothetical protein
MTEKEARDELLGRARLLSPAEQDARDELIAKVRLLGMHLPSHALGAGFMLIAPNGTRFVWNRSDYFYVWGNWVDSLNKFNQGLEERHAPDGKHSLKRLSTMSRKV